MTTFRFPRGREWPTGEKEEDFKGRLNPHPEGGKRNYKPSLW